MSVWEGWWEGGREGRVPRWWSEAGMGAERKADQEMSRGRKD